MISVYTAPNSIEAHMVLNLLDQAGIKGLIKDENLVGLERLDSGGFVTVYVSETDLKNAKNIIDDMVATQPETERIVPPSSRNNSYKTGLIGFIIGTVLVTIYFYTPYIEQKFDNNNDGKADGKHVIFDTKLSKTEYDRNFDGKVDFKCQYNWDNIIESSISDEDFDGFFETTARYQFGNVLWSQSDTTGDGFKDYHMEFKDGILETAIFFNSKTKKPIKIQKYRKLKLISAKIDTNNDGILNKFVEYNSIEEIIEKNK